MVLIDGCDIGCGKASLEHAEVPLKNYLVVTDMGIEKNKDFNLKKEDIQKVKEAVMEKCRQNQAEDLPMTQNGSGR